jgi:hypothetical protein
LDEKNELIKVISSRSDMYGNKLIDFLEKYDIEGLMYATVEQLKEYINLYL